MIRRATYADLPRLVELGEVMHHESSYSVLPYSAPKVLILLENMINNADYFLVVEERSNEIVGGFAGMVIEQWFSDSRVAIDFALFMHPDHRGGMAAVRLLKAFVKWANEQGAALVTIGITTGVKEAESSKLCQLLGFRHAGVLFKKEGGL